MIPIYTYRILIEYPNFDATWIIEATEEEVENVIKRINKRFDFVNVSYEIVDEDENVEITHILDDNGEIWTRVAF